MTERVPMAPVDLPGSCGAPPIELRPYRLPRSSYEVTLWIQFWAGMVALGLGFALVAAADGGDRPNRLTLLICWISFALGLVALWRRLDSLSMGRWRSVPFGFRAVRAWREVAGGAPIFVRRREEDSTAMYPCNHIVTTVCPGPKVRTRGGQRWEVAVKVIVQLADVEKLHQWVMAGEAPMEILGDLFREIIQARFDRTPFADPRRELVPTSVAMRKGLSTINRKLAESGLYLHLVSLESLAPVELASAALLPMRGVNPMQSMTEEHDLVLRGVTLPDVFDYQRIRRDLERVSSLGLLSKYMHVARRRFHAKTEIALLEALQRYYEAGTRTVQAAQALERAEIEHQLELRRQLYQGVEDEALHHVQMERHRADALDARAAAMRHRVEEAKSERELEKLRHGGNGRLKLEDLSEEERLFRGAEQEVNQGSAIDDARDRALAKFIERIRARKDLTEDVQSERIEDMADRLDRWAERKRGERS